MRHRQYLFAQPIHKPNHTKVNVSGRKDVDEFHCNFEAMDLCYRWIASCGNASARDGALFHTERKRISAQRDDELRRNNAMIGDKNNSELKYDMNFYYDTAFGWDASTTTTTTTLLVLLFEEIYEEKVWNRERERCINWNRS